MIHNHRQVYRVIQDALREGTDKELLAHAEKFRKEGMGWRYDGLGQWTTEAIFEQLRALGIDIDPERFEEQAKAAGRCFELEEKWREGIEIDDKTPWDDFPFLACEELWRRLTPNLLCPEVVAARLEEAIERQSEDVDWEAPDVGKEDIDAAMMLMDYLEGLPAQERQNAFEHVIECSAFDFGEWLVDIAMDYGDKHVDQARRIADAMSETKYAENLWTDFAYSLVSADQFEEAKGLVEDNLERWPHDVWVRIKSGDIYRDIADTKTAVACYMAALEMASKPYDWEGVAERLGPLLRKLGRREEWDRLRREHPRPAASPIIPFSSASRGLHQAVAPIDPSGPIGVITSAPSPRVVSVSSPPSLSSDKVSRNAPCPCGSGKKYKKCCLKRE